MRANPNTNTNPNPNPNQVSRMLAKLRPLVHGATLTGAGGGGFLLLVTKEPDAREAVRAALADEQVVLHDVSVDEEGLRTRFEAATTTHPQE